MALTPIGSVTLASGASQNVTVVDQNGNPLPDSSIQWTVVANVTIGPDAVNGGFLFTAGQAGASQPMATHTPSGHTATLPVTVTNPVTAISFATA